MSLLNDVLRDLDQRSAIPAAEKLHLAHATRDPSGDDYPVARKARFDLTRALVWPLVFIASGFGAWVFVQPDPTPVVSSLEPVRPAAVAVSAAVEERVPTPSVGVESDSRRPPATPEAMVVEAVAPEEPPQSVSIADATVPTADIEEAQPRTAVAKEDVPQPEAGPAEAETPNYLALKNTEVPDVMPVEPAVAVKRRTPAPLAASEQARQQIEAGDLAAAEETVTQRLASHPDDRAARELQIGLLLRGGRYDAALVAIDEGLKGHPDNRKLRLIKARLLAQRGETGPAIELLQAITAQPPASREALQMLGALYQQRQEYAAAIEVYRRLVTTTPSAGSAWVGLAIALDGKGQDGALDAYRRALSLGGLPPAAERYARQRRASLEAGNG
jgi:Flp pilus assembly protein TadD